MNMNTLATLALANTTVVIDINGQIRELLPGEVPGPGEVIVVLGQGATAATDTQAQVVSEQGALVDLNLDDEIAAILEQIEQGADPTQNEDLATAAGEQGGSSLTNSGSIERTGAETLAATAFETAGLEAQGLSRTQSVSLLELVEDNINTTAPIEEEEIDTPVRSDDAEMDVRACETDEEIQLNGQLESESAFVSQTNIAGAHGTFNLAVDGSWTYMAYEAFDQLAPGESLQDEFTVYDEDGVATVVNVYIDGTNDQPEFMQLNDDGELTDTKAEAYSFSYDEERQAGDKVGQVGFVDPDNQQHEYEIVQNVQDGQGNDLYMINPDTGEIGLTEFGEQAYSDGFEPLMQQHNIEVTVKTLDVPDDQVLGDCDEPHTATVNVYFSVPGGNNNLPPVAECFEIDGSNQPVIPIKFNDDENDELDYISDVEDDLAGVQLSVMITCLPEHGVLLYTDEFGETRVLTEDDLHVPGSDIDASKLLNPDKISYVPAPSEEFEIGCSGELPHGVDGLINWGVFISDTERLVTLANGNTVGISITNNNGMPLMHYFDGPDHFGCGLGDADGAGLNSPETLNIDLINNPLNVVQFGLDGMGGAFNTHSKVVVEVTFTLADGTQYVEQYQKDEGDTGNHQFFYEFTFESPDPNNPITYMEFSSTGGNWVLNYISGFENNNEDSFDYIAVDSNLAESEEAKVTIDISDASGYDVLSAEQGDELNAQLGNQLMLGDENDNLFVWLDSTLDNGTDIVDNFVLNSDQIDLRGILDSDDNVELGDLIGKVSASLDVDNGDVILTVSDDGKEQTIVLEGVAEAFEGANLIDNNVLDDAAMLAQVLKTD